MKDLIEDRQSSLVVNCHILLCRPAWLMNSLLWLLFLRWYCNDITWDYHFQD